MRTLLVATKNKNKLREIKKLLDDIDIEVLSLQDIDIDVPEIVEDGATFKENALKKALETANITNFLTLADDSGLCIDVLNGEPGVYSARYAGDEKNDADNRQKVLRLMKDVPLQRRTAHFYCSIALALPNTMIATVEGVCDGFITQEEKGEYGFGYDSIFYYEAFDRTFAEISSEEKNSISHRAQALSLIKDVLIEYLRNEEHM